MDRRARVSRTRLWKPNGAAPRSVHPWFHRGGHQAGKRRIDPDRRGGGDAFRQRRGRCSTILPRTSLTAGRSTQASGDNKVAEPLAIDGGRSVRPHMLRYARQFVDDDDIRAVEAVLRGDWLTTGPAVAEFERGLCSRTEARFAVALNTGTAALHAAAVAAGIGPADEVIVPAISFVASANCVLYCGGRPVFADVSPTTLTLAPADVERKVTPRTRAVVAGDFAGHPCDYEALSALAERHGFRVIQDAAHSLGATYHGKQVGALGTLTTLSFHPVKHITTGEGGAVIT